MGTELMHKITLSDGTVRYRVVDAGRKADSSRAQRTSSPRTRQRGPVTLENVRTVG